MNAPNHPVTLAMEHNGNDMNVWGVRGESTVMDDIDVAPVFPACALPDLGGAPAPRMATARVLVAGVGNVFYGDDGFGVEVAKRLQRRHLPAGVDVMDFGIRGFDLACALGSVESVILVDAYPHGRPPGDLTVLEPNLASAGDEGADDVPEVEPHGLEAVSVLRLAQAMHRLPARLFLVGCEPATGAGADGLVGLSAPVRAAVDHAVSLCESLAADLLRA